MLISSVKVRLRLLRDLTFFAFYILMACTPKESRTPELIWREDQAIGITIPIHLFETHSAAKSNMNVRLKSGTVNMLGDFNDVGNAIIFTPLVPLTRGLSYEIIEGGKVIAIVDVPPPDKHLIPALTAIYPTQDTVPENLLKIYLAFSRPMQEGKSISYLTLLKDNGDTAKGVFLDLQPELWNVGRNVLTIWLDPGRIKRGLHPNQKYGQPLVRGMHYRLTVLKTWKDVSGATLPQAYVKDFTVALRDSISPDPSRWKISPPKANTSDALCIDFDSPMDYSLLTAALQISDGEGNLVTGTWSTENEERRACYTPDAAWKPSQYELRVETRLEDLAGNNLNRAFETEITSKRNEVSGDQITLPFIVVP